MKTAEEIRPIYKVIADYPHSPYKIGDILEEYTKTAYKITVTYNGNSMNEEQVNTYPSSAIDNFPALFQKINAGESLAASHPPAAPASGEELAEYKKPFRIGRKQKRAILDAEGQFVGVFSPGNENTAKLFCDWANGATLPTREQGGEKEKFAIRFSEWLMIQCEYKNHCVWEYHGEEYTQNELIEIFKRTTPLPSPPKH